MSSKKQVTILLPCLNEEKTLEKCILRIKKVMDKSKYKEKYTILVCDNNSTDNSINICKKNKVNYTICKKRGNGATLINGINKAKTEYLAMLDADCSYDERDLPKMLDLLEEYDLVIGNRFKGTIEKKAMPKKNHIGSSFLSKYADLLFHAKVGDYHCGIRTFKRKKILECNLETVGFEFASEMIIKAKLHNLTIKEIPTNLFKDERDRKPHLKPFKDGFRHLHTINKIKWNNSIIFRYLTTFIITLLSLFILLFASQLIPHKYVEKNIIKSSQELLEIYKKENKAKTNQIYEKAGDIRLLSIIYSENEKLPLKSLIEMNYNDQCDKNMQECASILSEEKQSNLIDYSRYWHGQTIYEKFLLIFTTIKTINIINIVLILLLLIYASITIFKRDKFLSLLFLLTMLSTNIIFMATSMQYIPIMYVVLISTIVLLKLTKNNSKNIDILFLITGMCTCFFDFLTAETLSLTIPLLIYIYIMKKEKTINYKEVIKLIILWGIGYSFTFLSKWLIAFIHYGPEYINNVISHAQIRVYDSKEKFNIIERIINILSLVKPFDIIKNGGIIAILVTLITFLYNLLYNKKNLIYYLVLLIPIIRFIILPSHSLLFYYFTYRAFSIILFLSLITIYDIIKSIIGDESYEKK